MGQGIEELGNYYLSTHWTSAGLRTVIHLHGNGDVLLYYQWNAVRYKDVIFFQKFYLNLVILTEFGKFTTGEELSPSHLKVRSYQQKWYHERKNIEMSTQEPGMVGAALSQQMSGHTQKHTLYELTHYKKIRPGSSWKPEG